MDYNQHEPHPYVYYSRFCTGYFAVTNKATFTLAAVRAMSIGTYSLRMTIMKTKITFINIRALCVSPLCF
jgi:hypothetical protein